MKSIKSFVIVAIMCITIAFSMGCNVRVPPGTVGIVLSPAGFKGDLLSPGKHPCWGRDRMVLIETAEASNKIPLSILCKDDLNFGFDLVTRTRFKTNAKRKDVLETLNRQGTSIVWDGSKGFLPFKAMYKTYVYDMADAVARTVVSPYETTDISTNRTNIVSALDSGLREALKGTPVEVVTVMASNFDYPEVVTAANELTKQREVEIEQERAKQAKEMLILENRERLAEKRKAVRQKEAEAEAVYLMAMGKSLGSAERYLELRRIEADLAFYETIKENDKVVINGGGVQPLLNVQ